MTLWRQVKVEMRGTRISPGHPVLWPPWIATLRAPAVCGKQFGADFGIMNHNRSADGLRGIAALNVVVSHFFCAFAPGLLHNFYPELFRENSSPEVWQRILQWPVFSVFYNGLFAVFVFFVLSGYVLALPYFQNQPEKISRRFWARYLRLNIPVAAVVLLSWLLFVLHGYYNVPAAKAANSPWLDSALQAGGANFRAMMDHAVSGAIIFGRKTFDPPLWTINLEFIGSMYLLAYFAVKPRGREALPLLLVCLLLLTCYPDASIFFITLFCGSYLGCLPARGKYRALSFALGIYLGGYQYDNALYDYLPDVLGWGTKSFYNALGALLLVWPVVNGFGARILQSRPLQYLGRISYSIYLVHFLVLGSVACKLYLTLPQSRSSLALIFVVYVAAAMVLAHYFEKIVDRNAIAASRKFSDFLFRKKPPIVGQPG